MDRNRARLLDLGTATQKHGRTIDWVIPSLRTPAWDAEGIVIASTDHVGVRIRLEAVDANTLSIKMEQPAQITPEGMKNTGDRKHGGRPSKQRWGNHRKNGSRGPTRRQKAC